MSIKNDKINEECGIFGGFCKQGNIAPYIKCGLLKLQHRGQEAAGVCCGDNKQNVVKNSGLVNFALDNSVLKNLEGNFGIGHVRYSTFGDDRKENIQPLKVTYMGEDVSLAHNGNVSQAKNIREKFERIGEVFLSSSDSEVILKRLIFSLKKKPSLWTFEEVAKCLEDNFSLGAYCILLYLPNRVMAFRDTFGYRPLMFANCSEGYFVASEDVAFYGLDVNEIIEIMPAQGIEITKDGYEIKTFSKDNNICQCVFEQIYFSSSASNIFSQNVYNTRIKLGEMLFKSEDNNFSADVAIPVMDSGLGCAIGYSQASKIPFHLGLVRNNWMERSFIQPKQEKRSLNVKQKFIPIKSVIQGKRVVLIDDSLVRGTTSKEIIKMLWQCGAKEVHMRSVSPKIINTCIWGVDIPTKEELISYKKTDEQIAKQIGATSVKFLPQEALLDVFTGNVWCTKCFKEDENEIFLP